MHSKLKEPTFKWDVAALKLNIVSVKNTMLLIVMHGIMTFHAVNQVLCNIWLLSFYQSSR